MAPWLQALYIDHFLAECVLVGGARRAARMSTKWWLDENVLDFIRVKRPIEYDGLSMDEVITLRAERAAAGLPALQPFLWSSNNSVMVDREFWTFLEDALAIRESGRGMSAMSRKMRHALKVWEALTEAAYADGTGEPGIINADMLEQKDDGFEAVANGQFVGSLKYQVNDDTITYLAKCARAAMRKPLKMITNPCGQMMRRNPPASTRTDLLATERSRTGCVPIDAGVILLTVETNISRLGLRLNDNSKSAN